jgi:drug/metabolite transporter (DMT)-like permease
VTKRLSSDHALLVLLALLWGASYLFLRLAAEIPPLTLIALRVSGAAAVLWPVLRARGQRLPRSAGLRGRLLLQALFNSIGAWTLLAWGERHTGAGLAAVVNSTSPVFVVLARLLAGRRPGVRRIAGAGLGLAGSVLVIGPASLVPASGQAAGLLACLAGALLYACAALHAARLASLSPLASATGTMVWASLVLAPAALVLDRPWTLAFTAAALASAAALSLLCTALALLLYFRLAARLGAEGVASQSYLRAGFGLGLGWALLGERVELLQLAGLALIFAGVALLAHH